MHFCHYYAPLLYLMRGGSREEGSILSAIVRQSTQALAATARASTQIAADLVRPKEVDWKELVGWWRLDMAREDTAEVPPLTVQLTRQGVARFTDEDGHEREYAVEFRPASWPRSARLRFGSKKDGLLYECTVQRKLANLEILKLRGRVFVRRRFQGKVPVGTFIGRRRVVIVDGDGDHNDDDDEEEEDEYDDDDDEDDDEYDEYDGEGAQDEYDAEEYGEEEEE
jgi:hypothetical protein